MYPYAIGFDIGITSVGWAVVALDGEDKPFGIINMGSRIFDAAEQPAPVLPQGGKRLVKGCAGAVACHHGVGLLLVDNAGSGPLGVLRVFDVAQAQQQRLRRAGGQGQRKLHRHAGGGVLPAAVPAGRAAAGGGGGCPHRRLGRVPYLQHHRSAHHEAGAGGAGHLPVRSQLEQPVPAQPDHQLHRQEDADHVRADADGRVLPRRLRRDIPGAVHHHFAHVRHVFPPLPLHRGGRVPGKRQGLTSLFPTAK